jgi:hypothetical protein
MAAGSTAGRGKGLGLGCATQRLRRTFAECFAVLDRKTPKLHEAEGCRNFRYGHKVAVRAQKGASRLG